MNEFRLIVCTLCCAAIVSCHNHSSHDNHNHGDIHNPETEEVTENHHSDEIVLSPEKAKAAGVETDTVKFTEFSGIVPVSGRVLPASGDEATVSATVAGIVKLNRPVIEGSPVGKGTPLFSISTSSLQEGDISQRAEVSYLAAKTEYERAQKLLESKLITEKEFTTAKSEYENARLAYNAVGKKGKTGISISSPISGYVKEYMVKDGDFVEVGQPLMTVSQNRHLYLRAEVAEKDFPMLNKIVSAKFKTSYDDKIYDLKDYNGKILSYGKSTDNNSFFIPITFEFDNSSGVIPGSFAEVFLVTSSSNNVIAVPESALTEEQGVYFVYIKEDDECYRKQEVRLGDTDGELTEIKSGLKPGELLVTKGAIHVKLASAGKTIPGHTHNH